MPFFERAKPTGPGFTLGMRGYDRTAVDTWVRSVERMLSGEVPAGPVPEPEFMVLLRGYDRAQVDAYVARARAKLAE
ncbi:hypothetical protein Afil01_54080 [Actinorhabdospora filicis]|uniref:DivIVA domain-containing protein n=1 Tax=Actinorhabdospora filicis TaxID=1785913 RepID=A0A9W6WCH7_9ACTN|nr:hypothetical protein [Actinorhabdospora filicis]GLZ80601.1 hypothetical protein Afil01_54080 [Actinorhabdospora filicis]